jgi:DinB family protein
MMTNPYTQSLALLEATPNAIVALVAGLPDELLHATEGPGTWNSRQILEHLVWGEVDDWIPRIRLILEHHDRVAFTPFDREGGAKRYGGWSLEKLAAEFLRLRAENLAILRDLNLGPEQLRLAGRHPSLGLVNMAQLIASWVAHDLAHLDQITRTLARQYTTDVGPWRDFMRVLRV